jgi:hypothetical protein
MWYYRCRFWAHYCFFSTHTTYLNILPKATARKATSVLLADDTSILITHPNSTQFQNDSSAAFDQIDKWFKVYQLTLNLEKLI